MAKHDNDEIIDLMIDLMAELQMIEMKAAELRLRLEPMSNKLLDQSKIN